MAVCVVDMEIPANGADLTRLGATVAATALIISGHLAADSTPSARGRPPCLSTKVLTPSETLAFSQVFSRRLTYFGVIEFAFPHFRALS